MTNNYVPNDNPEVTLKHNDEDNASLHFLLCQLIQGVQRVERQLEILTGEEIDHDDGSMI